MNEQDREELLKTAASLSAGGHQIDPAQLLAAIMSAPSIRLITNEEIAVINAARALINVWRPENQRVTVRLEDGLHQLSDAVSALDRS